MSRLVFAGPFLLMATFAAAQSNALYPSIRPQPNPSTQPSWATDPNSAEPIEVAAAPPAFVPGQGNDAAAQPRPRGPVRISGGVMAVNVLSKVDPMYPADARAAGVQGAVVLAATIGKDGSVQDLTVVSGPAPLAVAATDAVRQWTYKPYILNGQPTEVRTTITVNFNLAPSAAPVQ